MGLNFRFPTSVCEEVFIMVRIILYFALVKIQDACLLAQKYKDSTKFLSLQAVVVMPPFQGVVMTKSIVYISFFACCILAVW